MLIYLSAAASRTVSRAALCELLWADVAERQARQTLRQTLWLIREKFGDDVLVTTGSDVTLGDRVETDRDRFLEAASAGAWANAAAAYSGPFAAAALRLSGALGFEQWATGEEEFLRRRFVDVASRLLPDLIKTGTGDAAWRLAARLRDADPNRQENWRAVLDLGSVMLSPGELLAEVSRFEQHLEEAELRAEPATVTMITKIRTGHRVERRDPWGATLVGRSDVLSSVLTARREAEAGAAQWLHLVGMPGVGKTRVLAEAVTQLDAAGWLVATAKGGLGARELPHGLLVDVIAALTTLPGAKGASGHSLATLSALPHQIAQPGDPRSTETLRLVAALRDLLEAVATERPLALIVDDLHWADAASLDVLRLLGGRLPNRVLLLTAARPLSRGAPGPEARVIQLAPLSAEETGRLVEDLGTLPDESWCQRFLVTLQQETGGNPLLVLETLRLADAERLLVREGQRWKVSDPVALERRLVEGGVIESRFAARTPLERTVLIALAVVGSALSIEALAAAAESATDQVRQALYRLEHAGHVVPRGREWAVSHDLITETLVDGVSAEVRRGFHLRAGGHLAAVAGSNLWLIRAAGLHLLRADSLDDLRPVWRQWVAEARRAGDRSSEAHLLSDFLGERLPVPWRRVLLRRPGRKLVWASVGVVAALIVVAVGIATTRPHRLRVIGEPITGDVLVPFPVVEVLDWWGRQAAAPMAGVVARITAQRTRLAGDTVVQPLRGQAIFENLRLIEPPSNPQDSSVELTFSADGVRPAVVRLDLEVWRREHIGLHLIGGSFNGQELDSVRRTIRASAGAAIRGVAKFRYTSRSPNAATMFAMTPTWGDPRTAWGHLMALRTPVVDAPYTTDLDIQAPLRPGRYRLVFALGWEANGQALMSGTNWVVPPQWGDGNDLAALPDSSYDLADREGTTLVPWIFRQGQESYPIAMTTIQLEVF